MSSSSDVALARNCLGSPAKPFDTTIRTMFSDTTASIYAWPSRGGVIILDDAEAIDLEFLGLNSLDPPATRLQLPVAEDAFCQRLLLLGAKWWDSQARYAVVGEIEAIANGSAPSGSPPRAKEDPPPTIREKRFVKVGWPSTGGFCVAEFDATWAGVDEEDNLLPYDEGASRLRMARTMEERCAIMKDRFQAKFYKDLKDYEGYTFLNSWETKHTGEVGLLLQR